MKIKSVKLLSRRGLFYMKRYISLVNIEMRTLLHILLAKVSLLCVLWLGLVRTLAAREANSLTYIQI